MTAGVPAHDITVYNGTYTRVGPIADYQSSSVTWQNNGVGSGTLVADEDVEEPEPVLQLLQHTNRVVPVVAKTPAGIFTGRVAHAELDGPPGRGQVTATLVDDWVWLRSMLAWPVPTAPVTAQTSVYDTRTGPVETAVKGYLQAAITRLGVPLAVVPPPPQDTSPSDYPTPNARFTPLDELLLPMLEATGRRLTAQLWLPDWPQPPGLTLSRPTIWLDVVVPPNAQHVIWSDQPDDSGAGGGIVTRRLTTTSPSAYRAPVGMRGEELERLFTEVRDDALATSLGEFGLPELMVNATDLDNAADGQVRGLAKVREVAGAAGIAITVGDGEPYTFGFEAGADYGIGSRARARTAGVFVEDVINRVTDTDNASDGRLLIPQLGPARNDESTDELIIGQVAEITAAIVRMNSGR